MKITFLKKIKEYLFVQHVTDYSFMVGKLGYFQHINNEYANSYMLFFGSWFKKWFLEQIEFTRWRRDEHPRVVFVGPKRIYWWFLGVRKDGHKRFQITSNDHCTCC